MGHPQRSSESIGLVELTTKPATAATGTGAPATLTRVEPMRRTPAPTPTIRYQAIDLGITVVGIYVCYLLYALVQEQLTTVSQADGSKFAYPLFLMLVQCICNCTFVYPLMRWQEKRALRSGHTLTEHGPSTCQMRWHQYALLALSYLAGMQTSYMSLDHISFASQVLVKSVKMLPLVVMGTLVFRKKYSLVEYAAVGCISAGISAFFLCADAPAKAGQAAAAAAAAAAADASSDSSSWLAANGTLVGVGLSLLSLTCDGLTGSGQDYYVSRFRPTGQLLMYQMNKWATVELVVACFLVTRQGVDGFQFVLAHPTVLGQLAVFGVVSALGQLFIFHCVTTFGALPLSIITSTRKFVTILTSVVYFGHRLNAAQWAAVAAVFAGLFVDIGKKAMDKRAGGKPGKDLKLKGTTANGDGTSLQQAKKVQ